MAWVRPPIWALKPSETMRPAGSSAAELILRPVESRLIDWLKLSLVLFKFIRAPIAVTFVLILKDIGFLSSVILCRSGHLSLCPTALCLHPNGLFQVNTRVLPSKNTRKHVFLRGSEFTRLIGVR